MNSKRLREDLAHLETRCRPFEAWRRRALVVAVMIGVLAFEFGRDQTLLTKIGFPSKATELSIGSLSLEMPAVHAASSQSRPFLTYKGSMPDLDGGFAWLNSTALSRNSLRGKVVLVNFWTYTCINSLRALPYVKDWATKYQQAGLVVIGVHTPEFSFEKEQENVQAALRDLHVIYPVVMDNNHKIWQNFNNQYWPAFYIVDAKGQIRYEHFGEGNYDESERAIQELLKESGAMDLDLNLVKDSAQDIEAPPSNDEESPESYIGYDLAERFSSPGGLNHNREKTYLPPTKVHLNHWGLSGSWDVNGESAVLQATPGKIVFRFHSRDLNLVMAPPRDRKPIRFKVTLDGAAPGTDCGVDAVPDGGGEVREPRLYQLIRQKGPVQDRTFEIEFLDPGVQALDFTFG
jgi:thiol-disulfide isomerase/thioredoxin